MRVDVQVQLRKDGEPDILGAQREMVMAAVGGNGSPDEAIFGRVKRLFR